MFRRPAPGTMKATKNEPTTACIGEGHEAITGGTGPAVPGRTPARRRVWNCGTCGTRGGGRRGTFTRAAEQLFIAQPTLSQQIRQLEQLIGAPLLAPRPGRVQLTAAGAVLLDRRPGRAVPNWSRGQPGPAGRRPGLRGCASPCRPVLPDSLAVPAACGLRSAAGTAGVALTWLDTPLDAEFSRGPRAPRRRRPGLADNALPGTLPAPSDAMTLGQFEPEAWIPRAHPAARREMISLAELARLDVLHGPRLCQPRHL